LTFAHRIKQLRRQADMTQERLAELLHISPQAVSRWETGQALPEVNLLIALANLFAVTTDSLLGVDIERKEQNVRDILAEANREACKSLPDRWARSEAVLREGLKRYPDSWELKSRLVMTLMFSAGDDGARRANHEEMHRLCEEILAHCPDRTMQHDAIYTLCQLAGELGIGERARQLAGTMPFLHQCRQVLLADIAGKDGRQARLDLLHTLYIRMKNELYVLADGESAEEVAFYFRKSRALDELLYENDDFLRSELYGSDKMEWAQRFARAGDMDRAFGLVGEELDRLEELACRPLEEISPLVPAYLARQVREKSPEDRWEELVFSAEDDLPAYMENYFPEEFRQDSRYAQLKARLAEFCRKYGKKAED